MSYLPRLLDDEVQKSLKAIGAVVIEGARAVGKTETGRRHARSAVLLDVDSRARAMVSVDPRILLQGETPRLIDEWQIEPELWNHVRREVDDRRAPGQFILTGSSVPPDDITRHSGAGRIVRLRLRPMSLFEAGRSTGSISLAALMEGEAVSAADSGVTVQDLANWICLGGWPGIHGKEVESALTVVRGYVTELRRSDVHRVDGTRRDPERIGRFLRSLARNTASTVAVKTLAVDAGGADGPLAEETVRLYLSALERLMVTEDLPPWSPSLRSRARIRAASKRHFVDPSLAAATLRAGPTRLLADPESMGLLFESLVLRDLRVYGQALGAEFYHYRDSNDREVDIVIELPDGRWAAVEVKLGHRTIDAAAESLLGFASQVDGPPPAALIVIQGFGYGYTRPDGVRVVPIGALGP